MSVRVYGDELELDWNVVPARSTGSWRTTRRSRQALLVDVSVDGGRVLTQLDASMRVGTFLSIGHKSSLGLVRIRWTRKQPHSATMLCGFDFVELEPQLRDYLMSPIASGQPEVSDARQQAVG